jgi:hypothetical protein
MLPAWRTELLPTNAKTRLRMGFLIENDSFLQTFLFLQLGALFSSNFQQLIQTNAAVSKFTNLELKPGIANLSLFYINIARISFDFPIAG